MTRSQWGGLEYLLRAGDKQGESPNGRESPRHPVGRGLSTWPSIWLRRAAALSEDAFFRLWYPKYAQKSDFGMDSPQNPRWAGTKVAKTCGRSYRSRKTAHPLPQKDNFGDSCLGFLSFAGGVRRLCAIAVRCQQQVMRLVAGSGTSEAVFPRDYRSPPGLRTITRSYTANSGLRYSRTISKPKCLYSPSNLSE